LLVKYAEDKTGYEPPVYNIYKPNSNKFWLSSGEFLVKLDPHTNKYSSIDGKYLIYSPKLIKLLEKLLQDSSEICSITKVTNNQRITSHYFIKRKSAVLVYSTGERSPTKLLDFGWITKAGDRYSIWEMDFNKSKFIEGPNRNTATGGAFKNCEQIAFLILDRGEYNLHYITNEKHAYGSWIDTEPYHPEHWGISIFPISMSLYDNYKSEIGKIFYHYLHVMDFQGGSVVEDNKGRLWCTLTTEENPVHIYNYKQKQFIPVSIPTKCLSYGLTTLIIKDNSGNLWFPSGDNKIIKMDTNGVCEDKFVLNDFVGNKKINLNYGAIRYVYYNKPNIFWIASDIGLFKYNRITGETVHYDMKEFCLPNTVEGIAQDHKGILWISTSGNIVRFDPVTNNVKIFSYEDGIPEMKFANSSCITLKDGRIAFGGSSGFIIFNPDSIGENSFIPNIVITDFQIFNKQIKIGNNNPLKKSISESKEISLDYNQDVLTFEFASLDYDNPSQNKYAYKMEGIDPDWVYTDANRRFATYTKLSPGTYTFKVKGSNNDGVWNETGTSIKIIILPPWWKTWWAYSLYILTLIGILYSIWKFQLKQVHLKHEAEIEHINAEKIREVDSIKSRFFANISHEFRTPLTLILGPVKQITEKIRDDKIKNELGIVHRNASRLLQLVNQLLDLSKLESGKLKLEASLGNIVSFVKGIALSFESLSESKDISLKIQPEKEFIELYFDKEKMTKILSNILSNAFKFTQEEGKITISIKEKPTLNSPKGVKEGGSVEIRIRDTGIGIPQSEIPKLFDRFYQVDSSLTKEYEGTGIGLALTKELVELHHGSISVESEIGKWTEFKIYLPLGKEHLKNDEIIPYEIEKPEELEELFDEGNFNIYSKVSDETSREIIDNSKNIVLVVEDNYDMREYIKEFLSKDYLVEEAVNGEQGVRKAEKIIPDLIISDMMMPKMDGNELTRILKNDEKTSHIPIIILTAKSGQENKLEGLKTGADDYLTKPFDIKELQIRIENLIKIRKNLQEKYSRGEVFQMHDERKLRKIDEEFLMKLVNIINEHISDENFSIEEFSYEVGMSRTQLHRKLKALVGKSASQYLRTIRLAKAKKMIEEGRGNISETAYSVGFSSPAYFTKCFKEEFGFSPSESKYLN